MILKESAKILLGQKNHLWQFWKVGKRPLSCVTAKQAEKKKRAREPSKYSFTEIFELSKNNFI